MRPRRNRILRIVLVVTVASTLFYSMTGLVYREGDFAGALVVKPYPMHAVMFGGGEEGNWARRNPGQTLPWFMQNDLKVITRFDWEYGVPLWVETYMWGVIATLMAWLVLASTGVIKAVQALFARSNSRNRIMTLGLEGVSRES